MLLLNKISFKNKNTIKLFKLIKNNLIPLIDKRVLVERIINNLNKSTVLIYQCILQFYIIVIIFYLLEKEWRTPIFFPF